jgi:hypothetical protein
MPNLELNVHTLNRTIRCAFHRLVIFPGPSRLSRLGRDDQSAAEAACVSVAAGLGQNSARSSYPDPLADAVLADERMSFASTPPAAAIRRLPPRARSST